MLFKIKINNLTKIKSSLMIAITITMLVYNIFLRPFMTDMDGVMKLNSIGNSIVHIILPIMVIFDYILFDEKGKFNKKYPFMWVILPFIYWIFIIIRAYIGNPFTYTASRYPYYFIDIDAFGIIQVSFNVLIMIIGIIILGYIYVWIDKCLYKMCKTK